MSTQPLLKKNKIISTEEAVQIIRSGNTVATGGFVGIGFAEEIAIELEKCFLATGQPRDLTLVYVAGQGDGKERGLNHFGHEGLVKCIIGGHWGLAPKLQRLAIDNKVIAYNLPQGVISHLFRDIAAHKPGTLTHVGLHTFVDPRLNGGKINAMTTEDIVELMTIGGQEYLFYKAFPIDIAMLRGTTADPEGNITMEKEALLVETRAIAMAAHNSGGKVIVQVERIAERNSLKAKDVQIPGILVDYVIVARPENHWQSFIEPYNPAFSGELRVPVHAIAPMMMSERKIIARRAAFELRPHLVVNLGIGMPEGVANVANEEGISEYVTLTAEPGVIGGVPAGGLNFGAAINTQALIDQPSQFDFYDGGGVDISFLGLAQADCRGNVNVSRFGSRLAGAGGFINISQNAKKVVFVGTFMVGDVEVIIENGQLRIVKQSNKPKFIQAVEQRTFSGDYAARKGQTVLYVTERCVFTLTSDGLELTEIAPGIEIQRDILDNMQFKPLIREAPRLMDACIFESALMDLKRSFQQPA